MIVCGKKFLILITALFIPAVLYAQTIVYDQSTFNSALSQATPDLSVSSSIVFNANFSASPSKNVNVNISSNVVLDGNSAAYRGFYLTNGSTLTLNAFEGSKLSGFSRAVYAADSYLDFSGTLDLNNNINSSHGSAVYLTASTANFSGGFSFSDNDGNNGAAFYATASSSTFTGEYLSFVNNTAASGGGAVFANNGSVFDFNSSSTVFSENVSSNANGGALSVQSNSAVNFNGAYLEFSSNTASISQNRYGGAIQAGGGSSVSINSMQTNFIYNKSAAGGAIHANAVSYAFNGGEVIFNSNESSTSGGVIYAYNYSTFSFSSDEVIFDSNTANTYGGAVYAATGIKFDIAASTIIFSNNTAATQRGGAIYSAGGSSFSFSGSHLEFSGNTAISYGGAIGATDSYFDFNAGTILFENNQSNFGLSGNNVAGAIFLERSTASFNGDNTVFNNNYAAGSGGGAVYTRSSLIDFNASTTVFTNNRSGSNGTIYASTGAVTNFNGNYVLFENNSVSAGLGGGAVFSQEAAYNFNTDIAYFNENSARSGGAVFSERLGVFNFSSVQTVFYENKALGTGVYGLGGAIYAGDRSSFVFDGGDVLFSSNSATQHDGGAIFSSESGFDFSNEESIFEWNSAYRGGAVYAVSTSSFSFYNSTSAFLNNKASVDHGGAVYSAASDFNFMNDHLEFSGNSADKDGGAVFAQDSSFNIFARKLYFSGNVSENSSGGAVYADNSFFTFGGETYFLSNKAEEHGGAVYAGKDADFNFNSSTTVFTGNEAKDSGGAIYAQEGAQLTFYGSDTQFIGNTALKGGAVLASSGSRITFYGTGSGVFSGNISAQAGGAIFSSGAAILEMHTSDNLFSNNSAGTQGGAIYISGEGDLKITDASFINNKAGSVNGGGAIYMTAASYGAPAALQINSFNTDVVFISNTARGQNNDIYMNGYSEIEFNANSGRKIILYGGIGSRHGSDGNIINKTGDGVLELWGEHNDYYGDFIIRQGTVSIKNDVRLSAEKFELADGALYSSRNGYAGQVTYAGDADISGEWDVDLDLSAYSSDKVLADSGFSADAEGKVELGTNSKLMLNITGYIGIGTARITIIEADGGVTGVFSNDPLLDSGYVFPSSATSSIIHRFEYLPNQVDLYISKVSDFRNIPRLTHNQNEVAAAFDIISRTTTTAEMSIMLTEIDEMRDNNMKKAALDQLSGSFIANALTAGALSSGRDELFERLRPRYCDERSMTARSVWGQIYTGGYRYGEDDNSIGEFKSDGYGIQAGADLFVSRNFVGGLYMGYELNNLKQEFDKADMTGYSLGVYGGWFGKRWNIKTAFGGGIHNYEMTRNVKFIDWKPESEFSAYSFKFGGQAEYKIDLNEKISVAPFVSLHGGYIMNEKIEETGGEAANLIVDSGDYFRAEGFGGVGIEGEKEKLIWHGRIFAGYILSGNRGEYNGRFADYGQDMNIWGADQDRLSIGAGAGAEYMLTGKWSVFANLSGDYGGNTAGYYGNLGVNYRLCGDGKNDRNRKIRTLEEDSTQKQEYTDSAGQDSAKADETAETEEAETAEEETSVESYAETPVLPVEKIMPEKIFFTAANFETDSYVLNNFAKENIKTQSEKFKNGGYDKIIVRGNTDSTGNDKINNRLSQQRARSVYKELVKNGIDPGSIEYAGYGDRKPVESNATREGRSANRRGDIEFDGILDLKGAVLTVAEYDTDGYGLNEKAKEKVREYASRITGGGYALVRVQGHTDSTGGDQINMPLSLKRAKSVYDELIKNGIPEEKIEYTGYSSSQPVETNSTKEGRKANRRTDIIVE